MTRLEDPHHSSCVEKFLFFFTEFRVLHFPAIYSLLEYELVFIFSNNLLKLYNLTSYYMIKIKIENNAIGRRRSTMLTHENLFIWYNKHEIWAELPGSLGQKVEYTLYSFCDRVLNINNLIDT